MNQQTVFSFFAEEEESTHKKMRAWRDAFFKPFIDFCKRKNVKPDTLSYLGLLMVIPFSFFLGFNPGLALFFLLLNLLFDGLDGPLARATNKLTINGAVLDFVCDYLSFFVVFLAFLYYGLLNPFWSAFYLLNYLVLLMLIIICRGFKIKFFTVIRSKYEFYLVYIFWLISGINYFDPFLVLFGIYMAVTNFFLYQRIRWFLAQ